MLKKYKPFLYAFVSGFIATIVFLQGTLAILHAIGFSDIPPYSMEATKPFGVPSTLSLSFWGGVWGIIVLSLRAFLKRSMNYWLALTLFGASIPNAIFLLIVLPLKGIPVAGGWQPAFVFTITLINAIWAVTTGFMLEWLLNRDQQATRE